MKTRTIYIAMIVAGGLSLCGLLLSAWAFWQIYGIGGWRDEVHTLVGANATRQAMDDFQDGHLRLYIFGGENDKRRFSGRSEEPFEIWMPPFHPELGYAHRYSTEQFVEFYNRKMRFMHSHPDKFFPREPEKTQPKVE